MNQRTSSGYANPNLRFPSVLLLCGLTVCGAAAWAGNLPVDKGVARTPETRTLDTREANQALERDWLYQAMGEPLPERAAKEIQWARELAGRLFRQSPALDLRAELSELDNLEKQLPNLRQGTVTPARRADAVPGWIWYPEGEPTADAPAATRFFRCRLEVPGAVREAHLRVACDDACEVLVNGVRVGLHETWTRPAVFAVGNLLKPGANVLAVRAENRPAPSKNPASLIDPAGFA